MGFYCHDISLLFTCRLFVNYFISLYLVFRYNTKDYCIQQAKSELATNWLESTPTPHPPTYLLVRYSAHIAHVMNTHGPHTTNPHSVSSYPNIFFRLPTWSTFQNTRIYRSTGHRIMVQVEGL